uniref:CRAL-TRIO domain-containing protein n=1 Tax=Chrysotila carterae TaxID=13221 RepID=A0A7S4C1W5_CHRCT|mmetsp:Transcript_8210/g.17951  ORF Transcript_8210/g.17951 Transcript_8210/m.17951 type:complete len:301 (-) Transcript_8210:169-1071(-)
MSSLSDSAFLAHVSKRGRGEGLLEQSTSTAREANTSALALNIAQQTQDASLQRLSTTNKEYVRLYNRATVLSAEGGFRDIEKLDAIRRAQIKDKFGRDVFMFFPGNLPAGVDLSKVVMYGLLCMHESVVKQNNPYTIVWACNNENDEAQSLSYLWLRRQYYMVPHEYHANMRCLAVVHPRVGVRMMLLLLSYMLKRSFWDKLIYADRIEFLDEVVNPKLLDLPRELHAYDKLLDTQAYATADAALNSPGFGTFPPAGVGFSPVGLDGGVGADIGAAYAGGGAPACPYASGLGPETKYEEE